MKTKKCDYCKASNHIDNFICSNCGFDFDIQINYNDFGLPEITIKN